MISSVYFLARFLARRHGFVLRRALSHSSQNPPPRRSVADFEGQANAKLLPPLSQSQEALSKDPSPSEIEYPGTFELLSEVKNVNYGTTVLAAKAFAIATGLVLTGAALAVAVTKSWMGIDDTKEFATRMRRWVWYKFPNLTSRIHRHFDPAEEDPRPSFYLGELDDAPVPFETGGDRRESHEDNVDDLWSWSQAEERLRVAYEEGGLSEWIKAAAKELNTEARIERRNRIRFRKDRE